MRQRSTRTTAWVGVLLAAGLLLVACRSSGTGGDSTSGATGTSPAGSGGGLAAATAYLTAAYAGTDGALPSSAPKPQAGKKVWIIACSLAAEGCKTPADAAKRAGSKLGWKTTVYDGKFDPAAQNTGVKAAIAAGAQAIVLIAVDCTTVRTSLQQAKAAGIKLFSIYGIDCNEVSGGGAALFNGFSTFDDSTDTAYTTNLRQRHGAVVAAWISVQTKAKADTLIVQQSDLNNHVAETAGYETGLSKYCPGCRTKTVSFTGQDLVTGNLKNVVAAALTKDRDINAVIAPYDAAVSAGIGPAVQAAGRPLLLAGFEGLTANVAEIKGNGPQGFADGVPSQWVGWAAVDEVNRLFAGRPLVNEGIGDQAIDHTHNLPTATTYYDGNVDAAGKPKQDYEANFTKIWGAGS